MAIAECWCCGCWHSETRRLSIRKFTRCLFFTALWALLFCFLLYLTEPIVSVPIEKNEQLQQSLKILSQRLAFAFRELERLKKQNAGLKLVLKVGLAKRNATLQSLIKRKSKIEIAESKAEAKKCKFIVTPSVEYEQTRRTAEVTVRELWYFLQAKSEKILSLLEGAESQEATQKAVKEVKGLVMDSAGYTQFLTKNMQFLPKVDSFQNWRISEPKFLSKIIRNRLDLIQNPPICEVARTLHCILNTTCGLSCRLSRATECFAEAYRLKRTLVIHDDSWNENFLPLSKLCSELSSIDSTTQAAKWPGGEGDLRVLLPLDGRVEVGAAVPSDLSTHLNRLRGDPLLWWRSQLFSYLMRPLPSLAKLLRTATDQIRFAKPIVGICVDEEGNLDDVMNAVENHFQQLELTALVLKRRIFVSSSDDQMPKKIKKIFPHFEVLSSPMEIKTDESKEEVKNGHQLVADFHKEWLDVRFLSKCDFIVCADSTQLCHVAFALLQSREDGHNKIRSVGEQDDHRTLLDHLAIVSHIAQTPQQIELRLGDIVIQVRNLANGFSRGKSKRTGKVGIFPSYKVTCLTRYHAFSKFPDELSAENSVVSDENEEVYEYED